MAETIYTERPHHCIVRVWHGEDWYDPLPQLVDPVSGEPYDVSDVTFELFARPSFNHGIRFILLTSVAEAGIIKENAAQGLVALFYSQANVEANLPITTALAGWQQFLRLTFDAGDLGTVKKLFWTGPLHVLPAKDDPTA